MLGRQPDLFEKEPEQLARAESGLKGQIVDTDLPSLLDYRSAKALHQGSVAWIAKARLDKTDALPGGLGLGDLLGEPARISAPDVAQNDRLIECVRPGHRQKGLGHGGPETHAELKTP